MARCKTKEIKDFRGFENKVFKQSKIFEHVRNRRFQTKAQIKMTETIGVLVVFFILILFGIIFYVQYQKGTIREQKEAAIVKRAIATSLKTFYLPELRCTKAFDVAFTACVDIYKAEIFAEKLDDNYDFYFNIFGKSHIYLQDIIKNQTIELYNGTPAKWAKRIPIRFPVLVYNAPAPGSCGDITGVCDFGVLSVNIYE